MGIQDYTELVVSVAERAKYGKLAHSAKQLTAMAEVYLSDNLRTGKMYSQATLTIDPQGLAALPADYASVRRVEHSGRNLLQFGIDEVRGKTTVGNGRSCAFAIQGTDMLFSTGVTGDVEVFYYAKLSSLEAAVDGKNWLLESNPEIYLQALLFQVLVEKGELDPAAVVKGYLDTLIDELSTADQSARFDGAHVRVQGPTP